MGSETIDTFFRFLIVVEYFEFVVVYLDGRQALVMSLDTIVTIINKF